MPISFANSNEQLFQMIHYSAEINLRIINGFSFLDYITFNILLFSFLSKFFFLISIDTYFTTTYSTLQQRVVFHGPLSPSSPPSASFALLHYKTAAKKQTRAYYPALDAKETKARCLSCTPVPHASCVGKSFSPRRARLGRDKNNADAHWKR